MAVYAFEALAVSSTAVGFTAATMDQAVEAVATVESGVVRFRADGTNPTATVGHILEVGDTLKLQSQNDLQKVRFIRRDGVDATLSVSYLI